MKKLCLSFLVLQLFNMIAISQPNEVDIMGIAPVSSVIGDGRITAGFSREGKLVSFFYPSVGAYNQIPYWTGVDENALWFGAPSHLGCFPGLVIFSGNQASVTWLNDDASSQKLHEWEYPSFHFKYVKQGIQVDYDVFAAIDINTIVYSFTFKNTNASPTSTGFAYYALLDPCKKNQDPNLYILNLPGSPITKSGWESEGVSRVSYKNGNLVWGKQANSIYNGFASTLPISSLRYVDSWGCDLGLNQGCYMTSYKLDNGQPPEKSWEELFFNIRNGLMIWDLGILQPGQSITFWLYLTSGSFPNEVENRLNTLKASIDPAGKSIEVKNWWKNNLIDPLNQNVGNYLAVLGGPTSSQVQLLNWLVISNRLLADRQTGAIIASPILIPKYCGVWPRDASFQVMTWIALGFKDIADKYFNYLFTVPHYTSYGRWYQCYDSQGKAYNGVPGDFGILNLSDLGYGANGVLEEDQMATVLLAVWYYKEKFGGLPSSLNAGMIQNIANYLMNAINTTRTTGNFQFPSEHLKQILLLLLGNNPLNTIIINSLKHDYTTWLKTGLIRPSSDVYEFPGSISANLNRLSQIESDHKLVASRQSAYTNFQAAGALYAAADLTGMSAFASTADELFNRAEETFWHPNTGHFKIAFSTMTGVLYEDRLEDFYSLYAWPFQAYALNDDKIRKHNYYIANQYAKKITDGTSTDERIFYPMLLSCQITGKICGDPSISSHLDQFDALIQDPDIVSPINHYLPEAIGGPQGAVKRLPSAWPLGWSNAFGIMYLLAKGGYVPPELTHPQGSVMDSKLFMKINVRLMYWCNNISPMSCINANESSLVSPFCTIYHSNYNEFKLFEDILNHDPARLTSFRTKLYSISATAMMEVLTGNLIPDDEMSWADFFQRQNDSLVY